MNSSTEEVAANGSVPYEPPPPHTLGAEIAVVRWGDPWTWVSLGWHDLL